MARKLLCMWRKGVIAVVAVMLTFSGIAVATGVAQAATSEQINKQIKSLKGQLNEVTEEQAEILDKLDAIHTRKVAVESQINDLKAKIAAAQAALDDANRRLVQATQEADQAEIALKAAEASLKASAKQLQDQAVNAYVGKDPSDNLSTFMFKAQDMRQLSAVSEYLTQVVEHKQSIVEQNRELQGQAEDLKRLMDAKRAEAQAAQEQIAQQQAQLAAQKGQLDGLYAQVKAQEDAQAKLLAANEAKVISIRSQMDQLQAQSDAIAAQLRAIGGGGTVAPGKGILSNPLPGYPLTSPFGMRLDPVMNRYQLHAGQDIGAPSGAAIRAAASGTVVSVIPTASSGGYGNYTCISHGGGLATCYAHQSQFMVSVGQAVTRGQVIGLVGSTGFSTGPHLHFEVRVNGTPVNPMGYL